MNYNFNNLGEFNFNITASQLVKFNNDNNNKHDKILPNSHSVYVWPDNIIINNINKEDIPIIYKLISNNTIITKEYINSLIQRVTHRE